MKNSVSGLWAFVVVAFCAACQPAVESPDLALCNLKGKVKECKATQTDEDGGNEFFQRYAFTQKGMLEAAVMDYYWGNLSFEYNDKGELLTVEDLNMPNMKIMLERDEKGYIQKIERKLLSGLDSAQEYIFSFHYDENRRLSGMECNYWELSENASYTYDDKGLVATLMSVMHDYDLTINAVRTYQYLSFDKQGNWLERRGTTRIEEISTELGEDNPQVTERELPSFVETREITYW